MEKLKEKIICGQTCDCQSGDDCSFGSIDRANWNLDPIKATPAIDEVASVKNLTELSLTHAIEACKNIKNTAKREAAILSSAHDYRTGYTTALSVGKISLLTDTNLHQSVIRGEKEVDTIDQEADRYYHSFDDSKFDETPTVQQCFIAGANYIKASHVPIEEVNTKLDLIISNIQSFEITGDVEPDEDLYNQGLERAIKEINKIRNLIKS